mmetsp:Transcript_19767/g.48334  ORF Transcript_19767/g.48334 Transcript_19767/m.48334 type:complete len:384 (+) Transcript_19767:234-1385(+)
MAIVVTNFGCGGHYSLYVRKLLFLGTASCSGLGTHHSHLSYIHHAHHTGSSTLLAFAPTTFAFLLLWFELPFRTLFQLPSRTDSCKKCVSSASSSAASSSASARHYRRRRQPSAHRWWWRQTCTHDWWWWDSASHWWRGNARARWWWNSKSRGWWRYSSNPGPRWRWNTSHHRCWCLRSLCSSKLCLHLLPFLSHLLLKLALHVSHLRLIVSFHLLFHGLGLCCLTFFLLNEYSPLRFHAPLFLESLFPFLHDLCLCFLLFLDIRLHFGYFSFKFIVHFAFLGSFLSSFLKLGLHLSNFLFEFFLFHHCDFVHLFLFFLQSRCHSLSLFFLLLSLLLDSLVILLEFRFSSLCCFCFFPCLPHFLAVAVQLFLAKLDSCFLFFF